MGEGTKYPKLDVLSSFKVLVHFGKLKRKLSLNMLLDCIFILVFEKFT